MTKAGSGELVEQLQACEYAKVPYQPPCEIAQAQPEWSLHELEMAAMQAPVAAGSQQAFQQGKWSAKCPAVW